MKPTEQNPNQIKINIDNAPTGYGLLQLLGIATLIYGPVMLLVRALFGG